MDDFWRDASWLLYFLGTLFASTSVGSKDTGKSLQGHDNLKFLIVVLWPVAAFLIFCFFFYGMVAEGIRNMLR